MARPRGKRPRQQVSQQQSEKDSQQQSEKDLQQQLEECQKQLEECQKQLEKSQKQSDNLQQQLEYLVTDNLVSYKIMSDPRSLTCCGLTLDSETIGHMDKCPQCRQPFLNGKNHHVPNFLAQTLLCEVVVPSLPSATQFYLLLEKFKALMSNSEVLPIRGLREVIQAMKRLEDSAPEVAAKIQLLDAQLSVSEAVQNLASVTEANQSLDAERAERDSLFRTISIQLEQCASKKLPAAPRPNPLDHNPHSPDYNPHSPDYNPHSPDYNPHSPDYSPHSPDYNPHSPDYSPHSPGYGSNPGYAPDFPSELIAPRDPAYSPTSPSYHH